MEGHENEGWQMSSEVGRTWRQGGVCVRERRDQERRVKDSTWKDQRNRRRAADVGRQTPEGREKRYSSLIVNVTKPEVADDLIKKKLVESLRNECNGGLTVHREGLDILMECLRM